MAAYYHPEPGGGRSVPDSTTDDARLSSLAPRLSALSRVLGVVVAAIGCARIVAPLEPHLNSAVTQTDGGIVSAGSALALLLGSVSVLAAGAPRRTPWLRRGSVAAAVAMLAVTAVCALVAGSLPHAANGPAQLAMPPAVWPLVALVGTSLLSLDWEDRYGRRPSQVICLVVILFAVTTLAAAALSRATMPRGSAAPLMPPLTDFGILLLALAALFVRPDRGAMRVVTVDAVGGDVARRLLPPAALMPVALLVLCYVGYLLKWFDSTLGLILLTTLNSAVLTGLVWRAAVALNGSDARRRMAERERNELNIRLQRAMAETHHRVRNNLQIITALADMQVLSGQETVPVSEMRRISAQVQALAGVHDILTREAKQNGGAETVSAEEVLCQLSGLIQQTIRGRSIVVRAEESRISGRQASALVVVTNELITNALKNSDGDVHVTFTLLEGAARLCVSDSGPGFPPGFDPKTDANTGMELVRQMAEWDLQGTVEFSNLPEGGACVTLRIPVQMTADTVVPN